jgi:sugar phosphate isomerase/epimerase
VKDLDAANNLKANDVVVGTGVLDYPAIVKELKRQNFAGMAYIEREANWDHNMPDVKQALKYIATLSEGKEK